MPQLCFEVSQNQLRYAVLDNTSSEVLSSGSIELKARSPELKKEDCSNFLRLQNLLDFNGEVSLSFIGAKNTLAPQMIFGETSAKDVFELCFGKSEHIIEHNRFFEQTLVVVYEIEEWIKRFFVVRYPRIVVQHETTHVLRGIFANDFFEPKLHLIVNPNHFTLILVSKNNIQFFNNFDYTAATDLFYYTSHVWNQGKFEGKKMQILWHSNEDHLVLMGEYKSLLEQQKLQSGFSLEAISKIKHQLLCV